MSKPIEELKAEATQLGISFRENISPDVLEKRIEDFYKAEEDKAKVDAPKLKSEVQEDEGSDGDGGNSELPYERQKELALIQFRTYAQEQERAARKTRVVTIIDNDQRVNNQTTTCVANCSNAYFDLGTAILPLNEKVEVRQGHLNTLLGVKIPRHMKDPKDPSVSTLVMVSRYTIQYEDIEPES